MNISKFFLALLIAGAGMEFASAQALTPEQQQKALDAAHQRVLEERKKDAEAGPATSRSKAARPGRSWFGKKSAPAAAKEAAPAKPTPAPKPTKSSGAKDAAAVNKDSVVAAPLVPAPTTAARSGPKTKEERLADLLESYKNDNISPLEYHQQRAKILTEP
jgi:hypothetical protein